MNLRSTRINVTLLFLLSVLLASCAGRSELPNHAFEGTITQTIHLQGLLKKMSQTMDSLKSAGSLSDSTHGAAEGGSGSSSGLGDLMSVAAGTAQIKLFIREEKVAYDLSALGGFIKLRSIIDRNDRTLTTLLPGKQAMVFHLQSLDPTMQKVSDSLNKNPGAMDSLQAALPKATGKHMVINGYEADEYRAKSKGMDVDMWLTDDPRMKFYDVVRDAILGRGRTGTGGAEELFAILAPLSLGKVPVKTTISSNGEVLITSELSEMKEEKLPDETFEVPKDYTIVNADSMHLKPSATRPSPTNSSPSARKDDRRRTLTGSIDSSKD